MSAVSFQYRAMDREGHRRSGVTQAASEAEAFRQLTAKGLTPLSLTPERSALGRGGRRIRLKDLSHFTAQLGVLMGARLSISEALLSIAEQEPDPKLRAVISDVAARVEAGQTLAESMDEHRALFGEVYIESLRAAEKTGTMTKVLEHLAQMLERQQELRQRVKGALMYPLCVLAVLAVATTFLIGYVVPKFARMFEARGVALPPLTKVMAAIGSSVQGYWYLYAAGVALAVWGVRKAWGTAEGRAWIEGWLHKVPKVKDILVGLALARFSRVLGLSLSAGLGLIESLELAGKAAGRAALQADIEQLVQQVRTGGRLTEGLARCAYVTSFARRMMAAGETSAELPAMCGLVARHYERESEYLSKGLSTLIEPLLIVGITLVVLVVALSIFLPMWDMVKLVG
jgi:type IV pilus assembly protein PilC